MCVNVTTNYAIIMLLAKILCARTCTYVHVRACTHVLAVAVDEFIV